MTSALVLKFMGAAKTVTGSKTLIKFNWQGQSRKVLVDCGLFQGPKKIRELNWRLFPYAEDIDAIVLTHAHLDHCGYIPKIVKEGFRGKIYCTSATFDLAKIILKDSAKLQEEDANYANKKKYSNHVPALPLYTTEDAEKSFKYFECVDRHHWVEICRGLSFKFLRAGHILGSSLVQFSYDCERGCRTLTFSGDLGQDRSMVIKGPDHITQTDVLVMESTYGAKTYPKSHIKSSLKNIINDTAKNQGVIMIPAFSVGRTQEILYLISLLEREKLIPALEVFLDGPMSADATEVYARHPEDLKLTEIANGLVSSLKTLRFNTIQTVEQSKNLTKKEGPFIVISSAGMLTGGRIMHHLKNRLPFKQNALVFIGYQAAETKGRLLIEGMKTIRIHHEEVQVNASIHNLEGMSAHAYSDEILKWIKSMNQPPSTIILNHGEEDSLLALQEKIKVESGVKDVFIADYREEFSL